MQTAKDHIKSDIMRSAAMQFLEKGYRKVPMRETAFRSGVSDGHEVERWVPSLRLIEQSCYQRHSTARWGWGMRLLARFPRFSFQFSSLLGYSIS